MKRSLVSVIGVVGLIGGLMVSVPGAMAEESVSPGQLVGVASTPTQAEADAACSATPQPDADDTQALVIGTDIVCEVVFSTPNYEMRKSGPWKVTSTLFQTPRPMADRVDVLVVGSGGSGYLSDSGVSRPQGDGGSGGEVRVVENYADVNPDFYPTIEVQVTAGGGLNVDGSVRNPGPLNNTTESAYGGPASMGGFFGPSAQGGYGGTVTAPGGNTGTGQGGKGNGGQDPGDPGYTDWTPNSGVNGAAPITPSTGLFANWSADRPAGLPSAFGAGGGGGNSGSGGSADAGDGADGTNAATPGASNSGSGGGGGDTANPTPGAGGSGLVVVRYIPASVPPDPQAVVATSTVAGEAELEVTPGVGFGQDDSYVVESSDGQTSYGTFASTSITIPSLTPGANYTFRVFAVNTVGQSAGFATSNQVTIASLSAPTSVSATRTAQAGTLDIVWDAATQPVGVCTGSLLYQIRFSGDGGTSWSDPPDVYFFDDTYQKSGLDPQDYLVEVAAACTSPNLKSSQTRSASAVAPSATNAPTTVTASTGPNVGSIAVSVSDDTPPEIGAYVVELSTDNGSTWVFDDTYAYTQSDLVVGGLTPGTSYLVRVASQPVTLDDTSMFTEAPQAAEARPNPPGDPAGLSATVGRTAGSVDLQVTAGSGSIASYLVEWSADDSQNWNTLGATSTGTDDTQITVTSADGLADDSILYFRVYAVNSVDDSSLLAAYTDSSITVPSADAPADGSVTVSRDDTKDQLVVTVTDPLPAGLRYLVQVSDDSGATWTTPVGDDTFTASPMTITVNETNTDDTFVVRVAIADADGNVKSAFTQQTGPAISPSATDAPASVTAVMSPDTANAVNVTVVQQPNQDDSIVIQYTDDTTASPIVWTTVSGGPFDDTAMPVSVTGLSGGTTYVFRAATQPPALDDTSNWVLSDPAEARPDAPDDPTGLVASQGSAAGEVDLVVTPANSGAPVAKYLVQWSADDSQNWSTLGSKTTLTDDTQITITSSDGLVDDSILYFRVYAINSVDDSSALPAYDDDSIVVPAASAPSSVTVSRDDTAASLQVTVSDPIPSGATYYLVEASDDSGVTWDRTLIQGDDTFLASPMFITLNEQNADDTFVIRVAFADADSNPISAFTVQTGEALSPSATDAPVSITATMGATTNTVDVSVVQRAGNDDSVVVQYTDDTVAPFTNWQTAAGSPFDDTTSVTITGLVGGTLYMFRAATQPPTFDDTSNWVETTTPVMAKPLVPNAPTIVWSLPGDGAAYVQVAQNGGTTPTSYTVTATPGGETCTITGASGFCVVSNLTNLTNYTFDVVATNAGGDSTATQAFVTPAASSAPFPPVITSVVTGNGQIMVTVQETRGGGELSGFVVRNSVQYSTECTITPPVDSCALTGLTDGAYTIEAIAVGGGGDSPASAQESVTLTSNGTAVPDTPEQPQIVAGNGKLTVTVEAAQTGGTPTAFTVVAYGLPEALCTVTSPATSCELTGLTNGQQYSVRVRAENAGGFSAFTNPESATPVNPTPPGPGPVPPLPAKPSAPGSVSAVAGNGSATVTWSAATAPTDAPVIIYRAVAIPGGQSCQAAATATSCEITGLTNGTTYTIFVSAINAGGQGPAGTSNPVTPADVAPAAPGRPVAVAGNAQAVVSFTPASSGGAASSYTVTSSPGGFTCTVAAPGTDCVVTGLTNGTAYTFTATASNAAGTSQPSRASAAVTPSGDLPEAPAAPSAVSAVAGDGEVTVTVTPSAGGGEAESFTVTASPGGASCEIEAPDTSCVIGGLTNGTAYTFTAVASNAGGTSPVSPVSNPVTPRLELPAAPAGIRVLAGDGQATVIVTPGEGGGEVSLFRVTASPGGAICYATPPGNACVIDGLANGVDYTFEVVALNASGATPADAPSDPVTPEPAIDPEPVPLVDPPAPGQTQAEEDGKPVTDLSVNPDRAGTGLQVASSAFTLDLVGEDNRGNAVGLQDDAVLLLIDNGRARTSGTGFRPGSQARLFLDVPVIGDGSMLRIDAAAATMDLGSISVDSLGQFSGTVRLPADLAPGDYVLQVTGVTQGNGERAVSLGVRVVDADVSITLTKGPRKDLKGRLDRVKATGETVGIPAGTKLVPYFRFGAKGEFKQGVATIVVRDDGSFTWTRKVTNKRNLQAYVAFAGEKSNTVIWKRLR